MKITILEPLGIDPLKLNEYIEKLTQMGHEVEVYEFRPTTADETTNRLMDSDIVILTNAPLPATVIDNCPNLKLISLAFTGYDHVDITNASNKKIVVTNAGDYSTDSVAEMAFGLIFAVYRKIIALDNLTRNQGSRDGYIGTELKGKTLGIVGTGSIGTRIAEIGSVFGCRLLGYNHSEKEECKNLGLKYVDLNTLLKESDIVSVSLPLNNETSNIIDVGQINLMKPTSIFINTARGGIVNDDALAKALNEGRLAGAGVDVFDVEPPIPLDYPLIDAKNTVLTPHAAYATKEAIYRRTETAFGNVFSWLDGKTINRVS